MGLGRMGRSAAVAVITLLVGSVAGAELAKWNQERVTKYAEELKASTRDLVQALSTVHATGVIHKDMFYQARETVGLMDHAADGLAAALEAGEGLDATLPRFKRIQALRRDAEEQAKKAELPEAVLDKVFPVGTALFKLRPYYQDEPMPEEPKTP